MSIVSTIGLLIALPLITGESTCHPGCSEQFGSRGALQLVSARSAPKVSSVARPIQSSIRPVQATQPVEPVREANPVERVQRALAALGYDPGPIDGAMGPSTRGAIRAFENENDLEETGAVSEDLIARLEEAAAKKTAATEATPAENTSSAAATPASSQSSESASTSESSPEQDKTAVQGGGQQVESYDLGDLSDLNTFD